MGAGYKQDSSFILPFLSPLQKVYCLTTQSSNREYSPNEKHQKGQIIETYRLISQKISFFGEFLHFLIAFVFVMKQSEFKLTLSISSNTITNARKYVTHNKTKHCYSNQIPFTKYLRKDTDGNCRRSRVSIKRSF